MKAESSLAIHLRTGFNSLNPFLFQAGVLSLLSPLCSCSRGRQTAKHVVIYCPQHSEARDWLSDEQGHLPNFWLLGTADGLKKVT